MPDAFVSAHGGRWDDQQEDLEIPVGSKVIFYVADGAILEDETGYEIFEKLEKGEVPGGHVAQEVKAGEKTYDYSCWYDEEWAEHCGIFEVGTANLLKDLSEYDEDNPLLLSEILAEFPNATIYWVGCRTSSPRAGKLTNPAGAFPAKAG